jgi:hypothetical protein
MVAKVAVVDALRNYLGELHAFYFYWMGELTLQLVRHHNIKK